MKHDHRQARFRVPYFYIVPTDATGQAGPERLGDRLLRCESAGHGFHPHPTRMHPLQLRRQQNAHGKPGAEPLEGTPDPVHFYDVNSESEDHCRAGYRGCGRLTIYFTGLYPFMISSISRTATSMPTNTARLMMLCPIFNSSNHGTCSSMGFRFV